MPLRRSDVIEMIGEKSILFLVGGVVSILVGLLFANYNYGGYVTGLVWVLLLAGVGMIIAALYSGTKVREVGDCEAQCPYCNAVNRLVAAPDDDFRCSYGERLIPVKDGEILEVHQVRCGYCNELNFYSEKNDVLICEKCDHEIPITVGEGKPVRHVPRAYTVTDDERLYELVLTGHGQHKQEELIQTLQHMLALNRNQVKQLLEETPVTLLTGITRKKAEMLAAQLAVNEGTAEFHPLGE
jgi:hypothetical protein